MKLSNDRDYFFYYFFKPLEELIHTLYIMDLASSKLTLLFLNFQVENISRVYQAQKKIAIESLRSSFWPHSLK